MRKTWQTPQIEILKISETRLGNGYKVIDWTYIGGNLEVDLTQCPEPGSSTWPLPTPTECLAS